MRRGAASRGPSHCSPCVRGRRSYCVYVSLDANCERSSGDFDDSTVIEPLVSIGIPAYNRPLELERAVRSAIDQDHPQIEVVISDDASSDAQVAATCLRLQAESARVRFIRQPANLGHDRNYQRVLEEARGEYFMWLADDDWLDPTYVSKCLGVLLAQPATVLVCGQARCYRDGDYVLTEHPIDLASSRAGLRLIAYFGQVSLNGLLFGVAHRNDLLAVGFRSVVAGDWSLVADLASRGRVRTLRDVHIHRSLDGLGSDPRRLAEGFGLRGVVARQHHILVAWRMAIEIASGRLGRPLRGSVARVTVGVVVGLEILTRFTGIALFRALVGERLFTQFERSVARGLLTTSRADENDARSSAR